MLLNATAIPLSLYIHLPWCVRKCPYCDFNSHTLREDLPEQTYIQTLIQDLKQDLALMGAREINTIFLGGGTPSLFSPNSISLLLNEIKNLATINPAAEITLEANPGTVEQARFAGFLAAGINRISLGVQSFQPEKLNALGRIHSEREAINAIQAAQQAGFNNINVDLMFGLPQQTIEDALFDLQTAIDLSPQHISWYQLTLEPNTLFFKQPPMLPKDELIWEMQTAGQNLLQKHAYFQYEISAYSQANYQAQHNLNYWLFGDYLGIGAGAHGKITLQNGDILRTVKIKHPQNYLQANDIFYMEKIIVERSALAFEFMLNACRLYQPIAFSLLEQRTGLTRSRIEPLLTKALSLELLTVDDTAMHVTEKGHQFLNNLLEIFL